MLPFPRSSDLEKIKTNLNLTIKDVETLYLQTPKENPIKEVLIKVLGQLSYSLEFLKSTNSR